MRWKNKWRALFTRLVARELHTYSSEVCDMLVQEMHKQGYGEASYHLTNTIREWMNVSDNWVDKHVLAIELEKDSIQRLRGVIVQNITRGWKPEEFEGQFVIHGTDKSSRIMGLDVAMQTARTPRYAGEDAVDAAAYVMGALSASKQLGDDK